MRKYLLPKRTIKDTNTHLLNIFDNIHYLDLGVIDYRKLEKLLKYRAFKLEDLLCNKADSNNDLDAIVYFANHNHKDISLQLFITYGLLNYKNSSGREVFAPLCLIPVTVNFRNNEIFIRQVYRPLENTSLIKELIALDKHIIVQNERLTTLRSLDKYCLSFAKGSEFKVSLKNYLTFARIETDEVIIDHQRFFIDKNIINNISCGHILLNESYGINYFPLSLSQKNALAQAVAGNSFGIHGSLGTGKTTTLINIALDAIRRDKHVLYISNSNYTLNKVCKTINDLGLANLALNLSSEFSQENISPEKSATLDVDRIDAVKKDLATSFAFINDYEQIIFKRVRGNHILEVLNDLVILGDENINLLDIEDLSDIYKHEFLEILSALERLERNLASFPDFNNSIWLTIPFMHNVQYPNQVITLIFKMHSHYQKLALYAKELSNKYGLLEFNTYVKIRELMNIVNDLNNATIPAAWLENDARDFYLAQELYGELNESLATYKKIYNEFRYSYSQEAIDIDYKALLKKIYSSFFDSKSAEFIDLIIKDQKIILHLTSQAQENISNFNAIIESLKKEMKWDFQITDEVLDDFARLYLYISQNVYHPSWLKINNYNLLLKVTKEVASIEERLQEIKALKDDIKTINPILNKETFSRVGDLLSRSLKSEPLSFREKLTLRRITRNSETSLADLYTQIDELLSEEATLLSRYSELTHMNYSDELNLSQDLHNMYEFFVSIENKDTARRFKKFLKKRQQQSSLVAGSRYISIPLANFASNYQFLTRYLNTVKKYGFKVSEGVVDNLTTLPQIINYIQNLIKVYLEFQTESNLTDRTISINDLEELSLAQQSLQELKAKLDTNEQYQRVFGSLYNYENTNLNTLKDSITAFSEYIAAFKLPSSALESFEKDSFGEIQKLLSLSRESTNTLNDLFRLYVKMFKDKISKYYYDSFNSNVDYLDVLLSSKDELVTYLTITEDLQILLKYNLSTLIEIVINNKELDVANSFKYTYYNNIWLSHISDYPQLLDVELFKTHLANSNELVNELVLLNRSYLKKRLSKKYHFESLPSKDGTPNYAKIFAKPTNYSPLVLANTWILNNYLNHLQFDLVIIDDAHLSNSNEYYQAINAKQVILAGERDGDRSIKTSLIARMATHNLIHFNYRFSQTPQNLLNTFDNLPGLIKPNYAANQGIEIIQKDLAEYVYNLVLMHPTAKINLFIRSYENQRKIILQLMNLFKDSPFEKTIFTILTENINIVRLSYSLINDAEYNIIYVADYHQQFLELDFVKMANNLFLAKEKLILYDPTNLLDTKSPNHFFSLLKEKISKVEITFNEHILQQGIVRKISEAFLEYGIRPVGSHNDIDLILEYNNKFFAILIFWDIMTLHYGTVSKHRFYYEHFKNNGWRSYIIWLVNLSNDFNGVIEKIAKEIINND